MKAWVIGLARHTRFTLSNSIPISFIISFSVTATSDSVVSLWRPVITVSLWFAIMLPCLSSSLRFSFFLSRSSLFFSISMSLSSILLNLFSPSSFIFSFISWSFTMEEFIPWIWVPTVFVIIMNLSSKSSAFFEKAFIFSSVLLE